MAKIVLTVHRPTNIMFQLRHHQQEVLHLQLLIRKWCHRCLPYPQCKHWTVVNSIKCFPRRIEHLRIMTGVHIVVTESFMAGIGSWAWQAIECKILAPQLAVIGVDHITKDGFKVLCHLNMKVRAVRGYP